MSDQLTAAVHARCRVARRERAINRRRHIAFLAECEPEPPGVPSSFGLTAAELRAHGAALLESGWSPDEVRAVLADPRRVAA